jgi:hypothetical protein
MNGNLELESNGDGLLVTSAALLIVKYFGKMWVFRKKSDISLLARWG